MKNKAMWAVILLLAITNSLTMALWLDKNSDTKNVIPNTEINDIGEVEEKPKAESENNVVATVGNISIKESEWIQQLKEQYGKELLHSMIDRTVIKQMANLHEISIPEETIDREFVQLKNLYSADANHSEFIENEMKWREEIETMLLLEELLTKDIVISDAELKSYYEENIESYQIPTTYHLSQIVVQSKEEAEQVVKELKNGSSFDALAMERSIDEFSANQGGDIGFVSVNSGYLYSEYLEAVENLKQGDWTKEPIETEEGNYAIVQFHEKRAAVTYTFANVKDEIRRQLALQQIDGSFSANVFWEDIGVDWKYGK